MNNLNVAVIGLGHVGQVAHLKNFLLAKHCYVYGVSDLNPNLLRKVSERYNIKRTTVEAIDLITDTSVDAVVIVVDRASTYKLAETALKAGKHVLTEKPMALNSEDARKLVQIARNNGLVYKVGFMRKYDEGIKAFRQQFQDNLFKRDFGRLLSLRIHCFDSKSSYAGGEGSIKDLKNSPLPAGHEQVPEWIPPDRQMDFLNTLNVHCHHINLLHWLLPPHNDIRINYVNFGNRAFRLASLTAYDLIPGTEFEILLEFGHIDSILHDEYIEANFEKGTLKVNFPANMLADLPASLSINNYSSQRQQVEYSYFPYSWSFRNQALDFINDVKQGNLDCINSGYSCLLDYELLEKLWKKELERMEND